ncbi:hypothetical protein Glove_209g12 [Diversispora epigaea]|uniref:chitin synthase n=1 Tax=Diversispora epigaea TaxID=1348612 RepID=A0A397IRU3_9GLOM|nr:hypothetical protein Glove_209g12 [Diversispora epigaea]
MGRNKKTRSSVPMGGGGGALPLMDDKVDLIQLLSPNNTTTTSPTEDDILNLLYARFKSDLPYTRLNASSLVIVNPNKPLESMNDASAKEYAEHWYKDSTVTATIDNPTKNLQPHIYEFAAKIYLHMRRSAEDQSVIFSGITGSGKTATQGHLLSQLLLLSTHTKKEAKIANQIQNVQIILEAFGNSKTIQNINASRFGKYLELQFSERGRIVGSKVLTYCFDRSRVTEIPQDERSYHVFYYLLAGATNEERSSAHLQDPQNYNYLSQSKCYRIPEVDDSIQMDDLRGALKTLGFKSKVVNQIWQILSAILLLGNIEFTNPGKAKDEAANIKNRHVLDMVAQYLGVPAFKLEQTLTFKSTYIGKELCTVFLNAELATEQRDALSRALYSILFTWIVEHINSKLDQSDEPPNFISLLDQPGPQNFSKNSFEQFCLNFVTEELENYVLKQIFDDNSGFNSEITNDGINLPQIETMDNSGCVELLRGDSTINNTTKSSNQPGGLISILDLESARILSGVGANDSKLLSKLQENFSNHPSFVANPTISYSNTSSSSKRFSTIKIGNNNNSAGAFGINHFTGQVTYSIDNFIEKNNDNLSTDFIDLFKETKNSFILKLFSGPALAIENHPKNERTVVVAQLPNKPFRSPSMKKPKKKKNDNNNNNNNLTDSPIIEEKESSNNRKVLSHVSTVVTQLHGTLNQLIGTLSQTRLWNIFQIRPNDVNEPDVFDNKRVKTQIRNFVIPDIISRKRIEYTSSYTFEEFINRYDIIISNYNNHNNYNNLSSSLIQKVESFCVSNGWIQGDNFAIGAREIFLSDNNWKILEDQLRTIEREERAKAKLRDDESLSGENRGIGNIHNASSAASSVDRLLPKNNNNNYGVNYAGSEAGYYDSYAESEDDYYSQTGHDDDEGSMWGGGDRYPPSDPSKGSNDGDNNNVNKGVHEEIEELPTTKIRRWWVVFVWLCTWWIPSFLLNWIGKMKRPDVQMAWREKFTLCLIIFLLSAFITFYIIFFGNLICPGTDKVYSTTDVSYHTGDDDFWVSIRGVVYDLSKFHLTNHAKAASQQAGLAEMEPYGGKDVSTSIPIPLTQPETCETLVANANLDFVEHFNDTDNFFKHTSGTASVYPSLKDIRWYWDNFLPTIGLYKKAELVFDKKDVEAQGIAGRKWAIINDKVYDLTDYFQAQDTYQQPTPPTQVGVKNYHYLNTDIETLFDKRSGQDITKQIFSSQISANDRRANLLCLNSVFYVGKLDFRKSFRCLFNNYILLAAACLMAAVILVKFLAALQLGSRRKPEDHDKFVICQVPCYTEGEDSLKRTMDSLAALNYDDKRKLLFFIADGMIVGSGNDRPTPRIVLDILGVDPKIDPEPLVFKSIGEGSQQLNYGKVYSGLYEYEGHVVPYIVVVKVGKPSEKSKPGNRGKRDSQIILMRFLNKVHFEDEMTPLELEIYHQMKNVIGVNPSFYEYVLMVDADTEVLPDALNRMISCMLHDGRVIGICGETTLVNEEGSWTTMIQVYEYYISHHLAKAFESLFGSVTCLPGCFCMYRIRTPIKNSPLIISSSVIDNYSENHVDTLHKKNLLSLGEDRYLTTLMMKHFPQYKMTFTPDAKCRTAAPDRWSVLLSQRRRWINSTIHNLMELMFLSEMCGVCCFSMRFVVFIDLFGTLILPSTTIYIIYLIWAVATERQALPTIALIMLAAVYGLQAIIFLLKQQWQHIGWMIIYLLAFPLFSFFIPIYSFWHFDDFSWGNTRVVVGEKGKKQIITADEEKFEESKIPRKKWADYEQEIWEGTTAESHDSKHSEASRYSYKSSKSNNRYETGSQYGGSNYGGSQYGGSQNQDYFRDTHLSPNDRGRTRSRSPAPRYPPSEARSSRVVSSMDHRGGMGMGMGMGGRDSTVMEYLQSSSPLPTQRPMSSYTNVTNTMEPTDEEILIEIRIILNNANLMNITKKQVREQLTLAFGMDMSSRKDFINNSIELILQGKL